MTDDTKPIDWSELLACCKREALAYGLDTSDADDVAQEACMRTLEHAPTHPLAYARRITRRVAAELSRKPTQRWRSGSGVVNPTRGGGRTVDECEGDEHGIASRHEALHTPADQEDLAIAAELAARVTAVVGDGAVRRASQRTGGAGRMARMRMRQKVREGLAAELPPRSTPGRATRARVRGRGRRASPRIYKLA